jgi:signal transduction histidine kinase
MIVVENDNTYVNDEDKVRIFNGHTTRPGGTGTGLTEVSDIARRHNAVMEVKSSPPKGKLPSKTTFCMTFKKKER